MSFNKKIQEAGWFYHAPAKPKSPQEPIGAPPPSQIPGLSGGDQAPVVEPSKMWIKDTDSAYIRLAKMGGREDLLRMRTPKPRSKEPKGYPRVDWYYHDDTMAEDTNNNAPPEKYEFLLPDYMVHQGNDMDNSQSGYRPPRLPYAQDRTSCYEDGTNPTDKTVKLPEVRKPGCGVRGDKPLSAKAHKAVPRTQMCKPPSPQIGPKATNFNPMPDHTEERACMGKILSFGYLDDWQRDKERWDEKQKKLRETQKPERIVTEYQDNINAKGLNKEKPPLRGISRENSGAGIKTKAEAEESKPDIFKLSKFKNVAARTDSHRRQKTDPSIQAAPVPVQAAAN